MPRIQKPYFNLHQLVTGNYTAGNQFVLADGTDYIGEYYIIPTGQKFTGSRQTDDSQELFVKRFTITEDSIKYNKIRDLDASQYLNPILYYPIPNLDDYQKGKIQRFFVQKRNNPYNTILEIDSQQYNSVNTRNNPGINGVIWNKLLIEWKIGKLPVNDAHYYNQTILQRSEAIFPGIGIYVTNPLEFWRY